MSRGIVQSSWKRDAHQAVGKLVDKIKLNVVTRGWLNGRAVAIKRRNTFGRFILPVANAFFRVVHAPAQFFTSMRKWQMWETKCFRILNPGFRASTLPDGSVVEELLPGKSLWEHVKEGTLTRPMLRSAALELRRAHGIYSELHEGLWSHGDAAMRNFLYDEKTGRTRLIDFELVHDPAIPADRRHADDLLAFLLDLVGAVPKRNWIRWALEFLSSYGDCQAVDELEKMLIVPNGPAKFWRGVRTNFVDPQKINPRLAKLRRALNRAQLRLRMRQHRWTTGGLTTAGPRRIAMRPIPEDRKPVPVPDGSWPVPRPFLPRHLVTTRRPGSRLPARPVRRERETSPSESPAMHSR